jgi:RNA polymerase sigma-70 factor, ECF subfamily
MRPASVNSISIAWRDLDVSPTESASRTAESTPSSVSTGTVRELSAEELAVECANGRIELFENLVKQHEQRIFRFLCQFTGNAHDAEDLTQEAFVKAFKSIHRFDARYSFATWLFTIAKRTALSFLRSRKAVEPIADDHRIDLQTPSTLMESADSAAVLWKRARQLKPKQFEALWLRYSEGFSIADVARVMSTNQIYVKVLLHRARSRMAELLQHDVEFDSIRRKHEVSLKRPLI